MQRKQGLFLLKFFGILVGAYLLVAWAPVNDHVIVPFTAAIARASGVLLNVLGEGVIVNGTLVSSSRFAVNVNNGCNGVEAMLILLAAMLAFPATARARAAGLLIGAIAVQVINAVRIVTLYLLGAYQPRLFDIFHTAVWQIAVILVAVGVFLAWSARVAPPRLATRA